MQREQTYMALERHFVNYVFNKDEHCFINSQFRRFFKFLLRLMPSHELSYGIFFVYIVILNETMFYFIICVNNYKVFGCNGTIVAMFNGAIIDVSTNQYGCILNLCSSSTPCKLKYYQSPFLNMSTSIVNNTKHDLLFEYVHLFWCCYCPC